MADLISDPDNVPVRVINGSYCTSIGSNISLTLNTLRVAFNDKGEVENNRVIAARLRFDLEIAKILRDQLDSVISLLTAPADAKPN